MLKLIRLITKGAASLVIVLMEVMTKGTANLVTNDQGHCQPDHPMSLEGTAYPTDPSRALPSPWCYLKGTVYLR